jgi:hypothetical protein
MQEASNFGSSLVKDFQIKAKFHQDDLTNQYEKVLV